MTPLNWQVFTVKRASATQDSHMPAGNESLRWVANSSTLIYGQHDAILVDTFLTTEQNNQLVSGINATGKNLKAVYITHAHADHFFGAKMIADHFPGVKIVSLPEVVAQAMPQLANLHEFWVAKFPNQLPNALILPEAMTSHQLDLEGHAILATSAGFSDTDSTTFIYVPALSLVVAGDIVYNGIHPYLAETTPQTRQQWIAALDNIAALKPQWVVAGHKVPEYTDSALAVQETRTYLINFERLNNNTTTALALYQQMLALYSDYVNPGSLWGAAQAAKAQNPHLD